MANTPKRLNRANATTTQTVVYTVGTGVTTIVTNIVVTNSGSSAATVLIRFGSVPIVPNTPVPANGVFTLDISQVLTEGNTIDVQASSTTVGVHICGVEVTA
ncbi:hypothetical protein SEA_ISSMI_22 [Streptomyces phage Issmi]|uniref:Uncharacterized protein n=1 Tax=Streptomyces phage Issmi TaxID=2725628 RepID=A0A6M3SZV1_9CAUD|nr:hypothetical protein KGG87_gp22 [Streptomyces phage Issmi]QJD50668.1 hypothetical protein SEA_ISSMI_22 [Streptomyces phage Issmi]